MNPKLENARNLYMEGIRDGNAREAVTKYTGDRYTQHSTGVRDGIEGFVEFFEPFIKRTPKRDIQIVRSMVDGQYVFVHAYQNLNDGAAQWVTTDFFDTDENDKIVEHWDVIAEYYDNTPSGHTATNGHTGLTDLDKTDENKALVKSYIENILMDGGDADKLGDYISKDQLTQHSKQLEDGYDALYKVLSDTNRPLNFKEIALLVGQGNFVATLCKANYNDGKMDQDLAQVDIYRIENGKIVEHWDNVEPVPENDVNGGKF
ncbi:nuclear transport factor 2 family protein [Flammeovirga yaeyamensis]|uniref:Nuclear transport factor 2 family protein n=1 Tax=Flammeovirga yaeyamensis TaxID=367791 RepID=A0AAX1N6Z1_9BACT|nr:MULTISPECIES: nuclear transport factor 2 family protein [Flammeovirga]ANQ49321.1 SnoaL-like domain-containing protein [Flammeovirga sp. MY04]MBB3697802.1 putative SnoaL-like aldol condensation-catalyzing enzyme [Flammeovirga yaeyamensis]NMF35842.1 SnoaL-like domain-containing protein [Flammeovirga yaeyamensis]QWG03207.1 nuclear transport factor 2 family protein [Flammeovirga yaeyamensis]